MTEAKHAVVVLMNEAEVKRVDDYRFGNRFTSRAAAIKWLLDWSLAQNPDPSESAPVTG